MARRASFPFLCRVRFWRRSAAFPAADQ